MSDKPVIVYGASGYTGRLICEYLREFNLPFIAAGRSDDKLTSAMDKNVPGIETADYEVLAVEHTLEALTQLFSGAAVVLNTVGPFARYGHEVVQACLVAGAHYTDTTGEQDWVIACDEQYGTDFAAAGLLLSPGIAQMYTTGEIAAQICLEEPGLDTLDIAVFWGGSPTVASTQTILINAAMSTAHYLQQDTYQDWDPADGLYQLAIPGQHELALALPWGGTSHPVWFKRDPRVANVRALGGVFDKKLMQGVPQIVAAAVEATKDMDVDDKYAALDATAAQVMSQMPPREYTRLNKSVESVHASGPLARAHCTIYGNSNYKQTGLLQAFAARHLTQQPPLQVGFASGCQAFGHRQLLGVLQSFGLVQDPIVTVER